MEWVTSWDEIEIMAETEEDIHFLKQLAKRLSKKALYSYDIGEFEAIDSVVKGEPFFSIVFDR